VRRYRNTLGYSSICSALRNEKIPCTLGESFRYTHDAFHSYASVVYIFYLFRSFNASTSALIFFLKNQRAIHGLCAPC
jgi:hypothetical protein